MVSKWKNCYSYHWVIWTILLSITKRNQYFVRIIHYYIGYNINNNIIYICIVSKCIYIYFSYTVFCSDANKYIVNKSKKLQDQLLDYTSNFSISNN
jgi:hypothetical protein